LANLICQPNELKQEIKKKLGGAWPTLRIATDSNLHSSSPKTEPKVIVVCSLKTKPKVAKKFKRKLSIPTQRDGAISMWEVQTMYKELLSKSTLGYTNRCFLKPFLRWKYNQLISKLTPYPGGTNSCFLHQLPMLEVQTVVFLTNSMLVVHASLWMRYKQLLSKSNPSLMVYPYAGGTTLRWWYRRR